MITFIVHLDVPAENAAAFEELMTYVVLEVYNDQAACDAHGETDWVRGSVPRSLSLITGMRRIAQYVSPGDTPAGGRFEELR
jgi:quinol monooxygenase YgiN